MLQRWLKRFYWLEDAILLLIFFALLLLAFFQVGMRNLLDSGLLWADSALRILVLWLAFWGAVIGARRSQHIRMEIVTHYFPPRLRRIVLMVADLGCAVISALVTYYSAIFVWNERSYGDIAFASVPQWWCEAIIPLAFLLLTLRFLAQSARLLIRGEEGDL